jgi:predicted SprT family Zn-dependent metalloprotease
MLTELDKQRSRFAPADTVVFKYRSSMLSGTILRMNPKRAIIVVEEQEYHVPYELLTAHNTAARQREARMEALLQQAVKLMALHGLKKWRFKFDDSTRRAGCCNYRDRVISISFDLARSGSDEDIRDTILHEIAHALVGRKHNHDEVWQAKAKAIGCSGERTHNLQFALPRYHVTCENRCWKHTAERQNRQLICRTCGGKLVYTPFATPA